ncbi:hypothetical protein LOK49_LG03G00506 [Camellia lanceoleosa]|uniref:Uncharacterized protein n=1 Tax=Camellia lanceoleosa TaxID=1840588 RepID=A0ACC0IE37_9ERIC|nr:hypothetical protein LOK49_LG03G00506 [Camellia lanceoleosa]
MVRTYDTVDDVIVDRVLELLEMQDWSDVSLNKLREVEMTKLSGTRFELEFIMLLLAKSPMLETMHIEPNSANVVDGGLMILKKAFSTRDCFSDSVVKLSEWRGKLNLYFNELREVEMHNVSGTSHELVFLMILLDNSPILETMVIKPDPTKVSDGGLRILKEVSQFRRLSPTAKITYKDPDANQV